MDSILLTIKNLLGIPIEIDFIGIKVSWNKEDNYDGLFELQYSQDPTFTKRTTKITDQVEIVIEGLAYQEKTFFRVRKLPVNEEDEEKNKWSDVIFYPEIDDPGIMPISEDRLTIEVEKVSETSEVKDFDQDIIVGINMALNTLTQIGVGPEQGFRIKSSDETWKEFLGDDPRLEQAKEYVFLKTKLAFDSSQMSSMVMESYNRMIKEIEWRLNVSTELDIPDKGGDIQNE